MTTATPSSKRTPMSQAEKEARALARARDERVHIFSVPGRPGVFTTKSKSGSGERYSLIARDGVVACSCRGFEHHKACKHAQQLLSRLGREAARQPAPAPRRAAASDLYA